MSRRPLWRGYGPLFPKKFSELLNEWQIKTGMRKKDFAKMCGLAANGRSISNYLSGKNAPDSVTIKRICETLGEGLEKQIDESVFLPNMDDHPEQFQYGWICPKCGSVYGPNVSCCLHCTAPLEVTCTY